MNRKNLNQNNITEIIYYVAGIGFFMGFAKERNPVWLCIGSLCLCLGAAHKNKNNKK